MKLAALRTGWEEPPLPVRLPSPVSAPSQGEAVTVGLMNFSINSSHSPSQQKRSNAFPPLLPVSVWSIARGGGRAHPRLWQRFV